MSENKKNLSKHRLETARETMRSAKEASKQVERAEYILCEIEKSLKIKYKN